MNKTEQMLFALLRSSLHEREAELSFFQEATADDWKQCHQIAVAQGVMALAWDGVLRLPKELQPPISLKLTWAMAVERYEAKYLRYCKPVDGGEGIAKEMMEEILNPPFASVVPVQSKIGIILYKTRRLLHSHHLKSSVFDISLGRRIWDSIWAHLRRPETIFRRGDK